jgi:peptide/nickel transport system substrate-binding protein
MYRKRLSRRRFLAGSAAAAAGLVALKCGGGSSKISPTAATNGSPKPGGVISLATTAPAASLDPWTDSTTFGIAAKTYVYGYLMQTPDWGEKYVGDIAESWEQPDELEWIFHIRPNVRFQNFDPVNGRIVSADDVVYSYNMLQSNPATASAWAKPLKGYEASDPQTLNIHLSTPYAYMFYTLGSPGLPIAPKEAVDTFGDLSHHAIGSGPFVVKNWEPNSGIEIARNDSYWKQPLPYLDGIKFTTMVDDAAIQTAFRSRQIDVYTAANQAQGSAVASTSGASVQKYLNRAYTLFVLNANRVAAFKDERVREAVDLAIDRQGLIDKLFQGDGELAGPVPPSWDTALPADEVKAAYRRDITKAKQLLSAAGQENLSFKLDCANYQDNPDRASLLQQQLKEAGINVQIQAKELVTWLNAMYAVDFETNTYAFVPCLSDDLQLQFHYSTSWNRAMDYGVKDDETDALLDQIHATPDDTERKNLAWEVQRNVLARHGPVLTLYEPYGYWVAYDDIKNYTPSPWLFGLYRYDMWLDKA